ncbi:MAG TPA: RHS repeat-associated core domain-containing protein, partial [Actinomycetota bacterium]
DAMGETSTFDWDSDTETATMTDAKGKEWVDVYDGGVLFSRTDPLGNTTSYGYDAELNLVRLTDPAGNDWTMTYDARGNLLKRVPPGASIPANTYAYNTRNDLTSIRQDASRITTFAYDASGNLIKVTRPGSNITLFGRDPGGSGLLVSTTDPEAHTTAFGYDLDGNLDEITSPLGHTTTMAYDGSGRMTSMVEPRGNAAGAPPADYTWAFTYDDGDNVLTRMDPLGNTTEWAYDDAGRLATTEDAKARITAYGYNDAGELTSVDPPGPVGATTYAYDERGSLETRTDPNSHTTTYGYDAAGRLAEVEAPLGRVWSYAYDPNGNLEQVTTAAGNATPAAGDGQISYSYDARNSLTGMDYSDSTPDVGFEYAYDEAGTALLTEMTDGAGTETYGYDDLDRLTEVERGTQAFGYGYDDSGNLTQRTYPDGTVVSLTYDLDSRLDVVTTGTQVTDHAWDAAGNLTQVTLPNATVEARSYDRAGRLTQVAHTGASGALSTYDYTLDQTGNPSAVQSPEGRITYGYDQLDRLTEACYGAACPTAGERIAYSYDAVGNRTTETRTPGGTTTYAYDAADQLTSATTSGPLGGTTSYAFDQNGNQIQAGGRTFTYDLANRLVSTTEGATTTAYEYDGAGKRLEATTGTQSTAYTWDPNASLPLLVRESEGAGTLLRRYVYGADLVSQTTPGASRFYHHDGLGSAVALSSATGAVEARYAYEPYGPVRTAAGLPPLPGSPPPPANPMRFTGEYLDGQSGLYHLRAREYDAGTSRFLQTDPYPALLRAPFLSQYLYANGRPTVMRDETGLRAEMISYELVSHNYSLPSCASLRYEADAGYIEVQTTPDGFVPWGAYLYGLPFLSFGLWHAEAFVDGRRVDKKDQFHPPHGTVNPKDARPGGVLSIEVDFQGLFFSAHSIPNACVIPGRDAN